MVREICLPEVLIVSIRVIAASAASLPLRRFRSAAELRNLLSQAAALI